MTQPETERLRAHLLALSVVNRELVARLDGSSTDDATGPDAANRVPTGHERLAQQARARLARLAEHGRSDALEIVRHPVGGVFLVEGGRKRPVKAPIVADALRLELGTGRAIDDAELAALEEGVPLEVYQGPYDKPFVVIGGARRPLAFLPTVAPVTAQQAERFTLGRPLRLARRLPASLDALARGAARTSRGFRRRLRPPRRGR